jgi:TPR repeat protein
MTTPARHAREEAARLARMEEGRAASEAKYTEFRMNCDAGVVGACNALGEWFELMRHDAASAAALYTPACLEQRYGQACLNLGRMLSESGVSVVPRRCSRRCCRGAGWD